MEPPLDHEPPRLSPEGEQLLADVLRRRARIDRVGPRSERAAHDTPTARASRVRRGRDPLRNAPKDEIIELEATPIIEKPAQRRQNKGLLAVALIGLAGIALVVLAISNVSTVPSVETEVAGTTVDAESATSSDVQTSNDDGATLVDEVASETNAGENAVAENVPSESAATESTVAGNTGAPEDTSVDADPIDALVPVVDPESIEVFVYDEDPAIDGVYSFALRLHSLDADVEIDTELFTVLVVDENGEESQTFSRFIHGTLPAASSALATVRSEGVGAGQQYVVVSLGEAEVGRVAIGQ